MKIRNLAALILIGIFIMTSCSVESELGNLASLDGSTTSSATSSPISETTQTATFVPSNTPTITTAPTATQTEVPPTITPTLWALSSFTSSLLYPNIIPVNYIDDTCAYLEKKWGEGKSAPGTIVVPIMFHSILKPGREVTDSSQVTMAYFEYFLEVAQDMGFETVTVAELAGFLEENEAIPERSMILILDDRRPGTAELFLPYLEEHDWTLTLAWPTTDATDEELWSRMEGLAESGRLDIQSHGHDHIYIQDYTPLEEIEEEIYKPIEVIQAHFGTTPTALVWPGGNFTELAIEMAHEAGFALGFTAYSRGPLMFNWIPLGEIEREVDDPLMVLPRYWSSEAHLAMEEAVAIGEAARGAAEEVKEEELLYYLLFCQPSEGE